MNELTIEREEEGDWRILRLSGCVDTSTFASLDDALCEVVESGCRKLRLDCQNLTYIDSTGLGLFLATHRQMRQCGGKMVIERMNDQIANVFNLSGFLRLTEDNEDEGLAGVPVK